MVLGNRGRGFTNRVFSPLARVLVQAGVSPNTVTVVGTLLVVAAALTLFPLGYLSAGALMIGLLLLADSVDGLMARQLGTSSPFGAFLDSTMDRISDAAVFIGLTWYLMAGAPALRGPGFAVGMACLVSGMLVSYTRARAEGVGVKATVGIAERADRLILALVATFIVGFGAPDLVLVIALAVLAAASTFTVMQRIWHVANNGGGRR